jgi:hypothetical protein
VVLRAAVQPDDGVHRAAGNDHDHYDDDSAQQSDAVSRRNLAFGAGMARSLFDDDDD